MISSGCPGRPPRRLSPSRGCLSPAPDSQVRLPEPQDAAALEGVPEDDFVDPESLDGVPESDFEVEVEEESEPELDLSEPDLSEPDLSDPAFSEVVEVA